MIFPMTLVAAGSVTLAASDASGRVALGGPSQTTSQGARQTFQVIVTSLPTTSGLHGGTAGDVAYINFGTNTVTAAIATGHPILAGSVQTFTVPANINTHCAAITGTAGSATLIFSVGYGE